ncbi:uncharacterized protein LOC135164028 [Diachasmimorpha longicaudata]|uniref:uncharacterized protein LOC135164028 n=1 Tax=Diachasmimorpha longicaudata TaxID=58733 RepID=UPI0030B8E3CE
MSHRDLDVQLSASGQFQVEIYDFVPPQSSFAPPQLRQIQPTNGQTDEITRYNPLMTFQNATHSSSQSDSPRISHSPSDNLFINAVEMESPSHTQSYLPLKLASDMIPRFDGKAAELTNFLQQCKIANSRVKPTDCINLLALICSKIEGHAKRLIANQDEPRTLVELIGLLKRAFIRVFDIDLVNDELRSLAQNEKESIEIFGARVLEVLVRGREAANEKYDNVQIVGIITLLNNSAMTCFTRGLRDPLMSTLLAKEKPSSLQNAIDIATRIEVENAERTRHLQMSSSKPITAHARVHSANYSHQNDGQRQPRRDGYRNSGRDYARRRDYRCDGHEREREREKRYQFDRRPNNRTNNYSGNRRDYSNNHSQYQKKEENRGCRGNNDQHLNSKGAPPAINARSEVLIARAEPTGSVTTARVTGLENSQ